MKIMVLANWGLGVEILKVLHRMTDIDISVVITRYVDNSKDVWENAVYDFAKTHGYPVLMETKVSFADIMNIAKEKNIDLIICHSFMKIIPKELLDLPPKGVINVHASLLPKYRGPSPTYWLLKNKEKITGITTHFMDQGIDTGPIIYQIDVPVEIGDNIGSVIDKQKLVVQDLLQTTINRILDPTFIPQKQNPALASFAPRPTQENNQ